MNTEWQHYLESVGANIDEASVVHFGKPADELNAAAGGNVVADLSHLDRLRVGGADAETFLLNQLSNDIRQLDAEHSQLSTYCNPKGRMFALFRILRDADGFLLISDHGIGSSLVGRLKMFVMRSKVEVSDVTDSEVLLGISGAGAATALSGCLDQDLPSDVDQVVSSNDTHVVRLPGSGPRFLVTTSPDTAKAIWQSLSGSATAVGRSSWEWLDLQAGLPSIHSATSEEFIPQMLNLDILNALNFKKGCYPGQEIIARMRYLGKLKQRMFLGHSDTERPVIGQSVFSPEFGDQSAGTIVNAQASPEGGYDFLFVAQIKAVTNGDLHLGSADGANISLKLLPYPVPLEGETAA